LTFKTAEIDKQSLSVKIWKCQRNIYYIFLFSHHFW